MAETRRSLFGRAENWRMQESRSGLSRGTVDEQSRADNAITEQSGGEEGGMEGLCIYVFFGEKMRRDVGERSSEPYCWKKKAWTNSVSIMPVIRNNKHIRQSFLACRDISASILADNSGQPPGFRHCLHPAQPVKKDSVDILDIILPNGLEILQEMQTAICI